MSNSTSLLNEFKKKGFNLKQEWLNACIQYLNTDCRNIIFEQLLCCDIMDWNQTSFIPHNFNSLHQTEWNGLYILQIEEIINLCAAKFENKNIDPNINPKLLRLKLTDGYSIIYSMVYQNINNLNLLTPKGTKIAIKNGYVRRGYLMLTNSTATILNGGVPSLNIENIEENKSNQDDEKKQNIFC